MMPSQTLSFDVHGNLGLRRARGYGFARDLRLVSTTGDELPRLAQDMPVAFCKPGSQWQAVAVLGPVPGVNLYVQADGCWLGRFVHKLLRSYPFQLSENHLTLALWPNYCAETMDMAGVEPLFVNEQLTPALVAELSLLQIRQKAINRLGLVLHWFAERILLQPWQVTNMGDTVHLAGHRDLFALDHISLHAMSEGDWLALHRIMPISAVLTLVHAHLSSVNYAKDPKSC